MSVLFIYIILLQHKRRIQDYINQLQAQLLLVFFHTPA